MPLRSAPAQKVPPAPVSTATDRSGSASKRRKAATSSSAVGRSTALRTSGRSMVTTTTGPSVSYVDGHVSDAPRSVASSRSVAVGHGVAVDLRQVEVLGAAIARWPGHAPAAPAGSAMGGMTTGSDRVEGFRTSMVSRSRSTARWMSTGSRGSDASMAFATSSLTTTCTDPSSGSTRSWRADQSVTELRRPGNDPFRAGTVRSRSGRATLSGDGGRAEPDTPPIALRSLTVTSALGPGILRPGPRPTGSYPIVPTRRTLGASRPPPSHL